MELRFDATGLATVDSATGTATLKVPIRFDMEGDRSFSVRNPTVSSVVVNEAIQNDASARVSFSPMSDQNRSIPLPIYLRPGNEASNNSFYLTILLQALDPAVLENAVINVRFALRLTFREQVDIEYGVILNCSKAAGSLTVVAFRREPARRIVVLNILLLAGAFAAAFIWNNWFNRDVHDQAPYFTHEIINYFLAFLVGFVGFPLASFIDSKLDYDRIKQLFTSPELYFTPGFVSALRSRWLVFVNLALLVTVVGVAFALGSVALPNENNFAFFDSHLERITNSRIYQRDVPKVTFACTGSPEVGPKYPMGGVESSPAARLLPTHSAQLNWKEYEVLSPRELRNDVFASKCKPSSDADGLVGVKFKVDEKFSDPCIEPIHESLRATFCGMPPPNATIEVRQRDDSPGTLLVEAKDTLNGNELDALLRERSVEWRRLQPTELLEIPDSELLGSKTAVAPTQLVARSAFFSVYQRRRDLALSGNETESVNALTLILGAFQLYTSKASEPLDTSSASILNDDFRRFAGYSPDDAGGLTSDRRTVRETLSSKRLQLRAYLRLLLNIEKVYLKSPVGENIQATIADVLASTGLDTYQAFMKECLSRSCASKGYPFGAKYRSFLEQSLKNPNIRPAREFPRVLEMELSSLKAGDDQQAFLKGFL